MLCGFKQSADRWTVCIMYCWDWAKNESTNAWIGAFLRTRACTTHTHTHTCLCPTVAVYTTSCFRKVLHTFQERHISELHLLRISTWIEGSVQLLWFVTVYTTTSWTLRLLRLLSQVTCFTWWVVLVPERAAGLSHLRAAAVQCHITNWKGQSCYSSVNYESYRNIKCCHTVYLILVFLRALLEFVLVCPHFSVDFHSACFFSFSLPPTSAFPSLLFPRSLPVTTSSSSPSNWCSEQLTHVQSLPTMPRLSHRRFLLLSGHIFIFLSVSLFVLFFVQQEQNEVLVCLATCASWRWFTWGKKSCQHARSTLLSHSFLRI